jgi:hypothetical protein
MKRRIVGTRLGIIGRGILSLCLAGAALAPQRARADDATQALGASDPAKLEEAKRHFQRGLALLRDPEGEVVEGAYLEFKAAYELSRSPRVLGNIGYCAMRMERNAESVAAYREYLRLVPGIAASERAQIEQDLVTMTDGAATVTVRYSGTTNWTLVDERIPVRAAVVTNTFAGTAGQPVILLLHAGHHVLHLKVDAEEQARWELDAVGGASISHTFEPKRVTLQTVAVLAKPDAKPPPSKVPPIVVMGVGGVALATGVVTGVVALGKMKDLERECPGNVCPDGTYRSQVTAASQWGTATDLLFVGGGIAVVGGGIWLAIVSAGRHPSDSAAAASDGTPPARKEAASVADVAGACVPGACTFSIRGSF